MALALLVLIDGLVYAAWMFLVAVGLTIIFGVMRILNVAHGSLYTLGAYAAATFLSLWFATRPPSGMAFVILIGASILVGVVMGLVLERGVLTWLHGRDEVTVALATFAAMLMLEDLTQLLWGTRIYQADQPYDLFGRVRIAGLQFNGYELSVVALALIVGIGVWLLVSRTHWGRMLSAVIHDREMAAAMGVNVRRVYTTTFIFGACLGALAGAYTAPMVVVVPGVGVDVVIQAFAVIVIGGMGSIVGAGVGALMVGLAHAAAVQFWPQIELFAIYGLMAAVLAVRPRGLFGGVEARKI